MNPFLDLHALKDGELDDARAAELRAQIERDPLLRAEWESISVVCATVKRGCKPHESPESWKTVRRRLEAIDKAQRTERFVGRYAWGICAAFLFCILTAATLNRTFGGNAVNPIDVASAAPNIASIGQPTGGLSNWLAGVFKRPVPVQQSRFQVVNVGYGSIDGRRAAQINLRDAQGNLVLVMVDDTHNIEGIGNSNEQMKCGTVGDMTWVGWCDNGIGMVLLGPRPAEDLRELAKTLKVSRQ